MGDIDMTRKRTTVMLTAKAQAIKNRLVPALRLRGVLSAALVLLAKQPDREIVSLVSKALADDGAQQLLAAAEADAQEQTRKRGRPPKESAG